MIKAFALVLLWVHVASAGGIPGLAIGTDLDKQPVGTWSEYTLADGAHQQTVRWSLVAHDRDGSTLEVSMTDATISPGKRAPVVERITIAASAPKALDAANAKVVGSAALQIGTADPISSPPGALHRLAANANEGTSSITVKAGTYVVTHRREVTAQGTFDYWMSDRAGPLGIVKLTMTRTGAKAGGVYTVELASTGTTAKPMIVKKPIRVDRRSIANLRATLATQRPLEHE